MNGYLDSLRNFTARGWAFNDSDPEERVELEIVLGERVIATVLAKCFRPDLVSHGCGDGRHGFEYRFESQWLEDLRRLPVHIRPVGSLQELEGSPAQHQTDGDFVEQFESGAKRVGILLDRDFGVIEGLAKWELEGPAKVDLLVGDELFDTLMANKFHSHYGNTRFVRLVTPAEEGRLAGKQIQLRFHDTGEALKNSPRDFNFKSSTVSGHSLIGADELAFWRANGYLVLKGFFNGDQVRNLVELVQQVWHSRPEGITVDDCISGRRSSLKDARPEYANHPFKINDLYMDYAPIREFSLAPRLVDYLKALLKDVPVQCNSLNFRSGSQQSMHMDSLFMTPNTPQRLIATWIALEDVTEQNGPLFYVPGSHNIQPFMFSNGDYHALDPEMEDWTRYVKGQCEQMGLSRQVYLPRAGDLLIWHAHLLHGGEPILSKEQSRQSLVCHYYGFTDAPALNWELVPQNGAYWFRRPHQPVPTEGEAGR